MNRKGNQVYYCRLLAVGSFVCCALFSAAASAQVVNDGSVGTTVLEPTVNQFEITGGTAAGRNLFHSFDQFSIPTGGSATFINNSPTVETVLGRITGNSLSIIDGEIAAGGTAPNFDLYLLNPNGIVFGPNALLNIGGSFFATTANGIEFGDQGSFHSMPAESSNSSLLTVSPSAMFFQSLGTVQSPQAIQILGSQLSVSAGESLVLLAGIGAASSESATGNLLIDSARVEAQSGHVTLGAVAGVGRVGISSDNRLNFSNELPLADILLQDSLVNVSDDSAGSGGGSAQINGGAVTLANSEIFAENSSGGRGGGGIYITAEELTLDNSAVQAISSSPVAGGDIIFDLVRGAGHLSLLNDSVVSAETLGSGSGGDFALRARSVELASGSGLGTETQGAGKAGQLTLETETLLLDNAFISANTFGTGSGGQIEITASDRVDLLNAAAIKAQADDFNPYTNMLIANVGDAGSVRLTAGRLTMQSGAVIETSTLGDAGDGGDITIQVADLSLSGVGTRLLSQVDFGSPSAGGSLNIDARTLRIEDGGQISTSTFSSDGAAGQIFIRNADLIEISGEASPTGLFAQVGNAFSEPSGAVGSGGNIIIENTKLLALTGSRARISASTADLGAGGTVNIRADRVLVTGGAQIQAATEGFAPGGTVRVSAGSILLSGTGGPGGEPSALVTSTRGDAPAGDITVDTQTLLIEAGGRISALSEGTGNGGTVAVNAANQVRLTGAGPIRPSGLYAEATGTGKAGDISVETPLLLLNQGQILASTASDDGGNISLRVSSALLMRNQAQISATAGMNSGAGNGGNVDIDTTFIVARPGEDSDIVANAFTGRGGNIQLSAQNIFGIAPRSAVSGNGTNDIDASSEYGEDGVVAITQPAIEKNLEAILPTTVLDSSGWVAPSCGAADSAVANQFVATGRGGVAMSPETIPSAANTFVDLGTEALLGGADDGVEVSAEPEVSPEDSMSMAIVPALVESRDWHLNNDGEVVLTAPKAYQGQSSSCMAS